jgi:hypothetical protein
MHCVTWGTDTLRLSQYNEKRMISGRVTESQMNRVPEICETKITLEVEWATK